MLEIFVIWRLAVHIGRLANQKGYSKTRYQVMAGILWVFGELIGTAIGIFVFGSQGSFWPSYLIGLLCAIIGAGIAFLIMKSLPIQNSIIDLSNDKKVVLSPLQKFRSTIWLPILIGSLSIICFFLAAGTVIVINFAGALQGISAANPTIGIAAGTGGNIVQPLNEIPSSTDAIYFGFDFYTGQNISLPVTFDWYIDNKIAYSFSKELLEGPNVVSLARKELGFSGFKTGHYEVKARFGDRPLTSATFIIK